MANREVNRARASGRARSFLLIACLLAATAANAADAELKPGDTIGPNNWQRIEGMVGENFLNRVKKGHTIQIKSPKTYQPLKEYAAATEKYSPNVRLGPNGELLGYVAGQPFPKLDLSDAQIGQKLAWNFFWRWLGDDYKTGGAVKGGQPVHHFVHAGRDHQKVEVADRFPSPPVAAGGGEFFHSGAASEVRQIEVFDPKSPARALFPQMADSQVEAAALLTQKRPPSGTRAYLEE